MSKEAEFSLEFGEEGAEEGITLIHFKSNYLEIVVSLANNHYQQAGQISGAYVCQLSGHIVR